MFKTFLGVISHNLLHAAKKQEPAALLSSFHSLIDSSVQLVRSLFPHLKYFLLSFSPQIPIFTHFFLALGDLLTGYIKNKNVKKKSGSQPAVVVKPVGG